MRWMAHLGRTMLIGFAMAAFGVAILTTPACGTDPVGVESCQKIEKVRCESAPACGINLRRPAHNGDSAQNDVAACIRYYDDQCLHGLALAKDPGPQFVDACVNAIVNGDCGIVKAPETYSACLFLAGPADAAAEATVTADATPIFGNPDATPQ